VRLGYRKELEAIADPSARQTLFERMVAESYEKGKALNAGACLEIDTVIDPAETRHWIASTLDAVPKPQPRAGKKHAFIDAW
jgi:acetyl-CoA carboxylase carboxyltransferase component